MLDIVKLTLGPVLTNTYLVADKNSGEAAVIDPAWDGDLILSSARTRGWRIDQLWYTHAHFDHIGGAAAIAGDSDPIPSVALHRQDYSLWRAGGGGSIFGYSIDPGPEPGIFLEDKQVLLIGSHEVLVLHTPGHTPGHCAFYVASDSVLFSGDLIFQGSVGRTDLHGGNFDSLVSSIQTRVYTLPDDTKILSGHGPETNVGYEKLYNPFVNQDMNGRFL